MYPALRDIAELTPTEEQKIHKRFNEYLAKIQASHTNSLKVQEARQKIELLKGEKECH